MMPTIDFYFDFVSPYAYLAHFRLPEIAAKHGCDIAYRPIDLKAAKLAAGNTAPATAQMPAKLKYAIADLTRWCARYNAPLEFTTSGPPDSTAHNIGALYAADRGQLAEYVHAMWMATFACGGRLGDEDILRRVATDLGWDADDFLAFTKSDAAASRYAEGNEQAQQRGVFGVPTMMVGDEMWWGNDRLEFLDEYLAALAAR